MSNEKPLNCGKCYGASLPYVDLNDLKGKLIVLEGTDGVGRSTQMENISKWLEVKGYGVMTTGWARSPLMGSEIKKAKAGHNLNVYTFSMLYLADFADRLEHQIIPALKSGFIVLADRYIYTAFVRALVRGAGREWTRKAFSFALVPDAVFYLRIKIKDLVPRVINAAHLNEHYWEKGGEGLDYWESGMDLKLGEDFYDSFIEYQKRMLAEFDVMAKEYGFTSIDASKCFEEVNAELKIQLEKILAQPGEK